MYNKKVMELFKHPKNMGEIKNADGIGQVGNPVCLPPNSEIQANPGLKHIEDLAEGARVLSHDGQYHNVLKVFQRSYRGELITIKSRLGQVRLTPEHLVRAISVPKGNRYLRISNKKSLTPAWHHASSLKRNDILLYPKSKKVKDLDRIKIEVPRYKYDFRSKKVPESIPVDGAFLRLAGYFIAEGDTRMKICSVCLSLSFGSHEKEYINDTVYLFKKIFNLDAKVITNEHRHTSVVVLNNVHVTRFFNKLFKHGCTNKQIPGFMLLLPLEKQKELLKGLFRGDGFVNMKIPRAGYSTVSYILAQQVRFLLIRHGIIPSIYIEPAKVVKGVNHRESYRLHIGSWSMRKLAKLLSENICEKELAYDSWEDEDYIYTQIASVSSGSYDGIVHNLEVDIAHSFATNAALLHNCGDVMKVYIKVKDNKIVDIKFQTFGCAAAIATSSMITELAKGKTLDEAMKLTRKDVANELGGLPPIKMHCSNLAADALYAAIKNYSEHSKKS